MKTKRLIETEGDQGRYIAWSPATQDFVDQLVGSVIDDLEDHFSQPYDALNDYVDAANEDY